MDPLAPSYVLSSVYQTRAPRIRKLRKVRLRIRIQHCIKLSMLSPCGVPQTPPTTPPYAFQHQSSHAHCHGARHCLRDHRHHCDGNQKELGKRALGYGEKSSLERLLKASLHVVLYIGHRMYAPSRTSVISKECLRPNIRMYNQGRAAAVVVDKTVSMYIHRMSNNRILTG